MKQTSIIAAVLALGLTGQAFAQNTTQPAVGQPDAAAPATGPAATQPTMNQYQTASYGIGYDLGRNIKESKVALDADLIAQGLRDCLAGAESKVTPEAFQTAMAKVQDEMRGNAQAAAAVAGEAAGKEGDVFREANAKKPGVKTTATGLQIETITEGTGESPKATDTVKVHYTGTLINGTKFDSSVDRGQPISFPLNGVIPGWTEGLQLMKVGGKSRLVIPSNLGYGPQGSPPTIPPNATLVFEVELLEIPKK